MFRIAIRRHIWAWGSILFHRRDSRDGVFRLVLFRLLKYIKIHVLAPRVLFNLWVVTQQRLLPGSFIFAKQNPICVRRSSRSQCSTKHNSWLPLKISLGEVFFSSEVASMSAWHYNPEFTSLLWLCWVLVECLL